MNTIEDDLAYGLQIQMVAARIIGISMPRVKLLRV